MDKQQAKEIVRGTLENPFDKGKFAHFIRNLLNEIDESEKARFVNQGNYIPDAYKQYISSLERIGKYASGDHAIDILIVKLKKDTSIERARTMQRNFIARYLNGSRGDKLRDAALVAFVSPTQEDWRFSLVKMDYRFEEGKNGRVKVREEFTPARRWSFLVGQNENSHTAQARLMPIMADDGHPPTLAELEEAFNIEKVTKEFFEKYRDLFLRTKEELDKIVAKDEKIKRDFTTKGVNTVDFAKKLLGQIVFLYFLQKKGWFGVDRDAAWGTGSRHFLRELFNKKHGGHKNFFNDILEPLFYEALRIDRSHEDHYYSQFNCKIPFLNGGLFDPMNNYDWARTDILIPDELFSNEHKTKEGDIGNGILDVFDRYNFTVKEDEPLEKEVAIDPEMLGKAYEKFNSIRPDNFEEYKQALKSDKKGEESKFNKQFGVYYTPREIVHYMCQQSLINYLYAEFNGGAITYENPGIEQTDMLGNISKRGQLDLTIEHKEKPAVPKEDIETLIHYGERITENEEMSVIKKENINAGIQKTAKTRSFLSETIRSNAEEINAKLASIRVCDPAIGSGAFPVGMMNEIVRARNVLSTFVKDGKQSTYAFKRHCIENSLYGVDIDSGAVEIAKLRLWLSLVVDEDDIKNIKPLPNLDYKIICGNSLLGYPYEPRGLEQIEKVKELFVKEVNPTKKNELRRQIDDTIYSLFENTEKSIGYKVTMDFRINFSEVFHEKNGFDVVIANPPYLRIQEIQKNAPQLAKQLKAAFFSAIGSFDIYACFVEQAMKIIRDQGSIAFILPHKFFQAEFGKNLRQLISTKRMLQKIVDFGSSQVFEAATTYTCLLFLSYQNECFEFAELKTNATADDLPSVFNFIDTFKQGETDKVTTNILLNKNVSKNEWHFSAGNATRILAKLQLQPRRLSDVCEKIFVGLQTSADSIYFLEYISARRGVVLAYSKSSPRVSRGCRLFF